MAESILNSVKKIVGLTPDNTEFDQDIILYTNAAFATLNQIGVGPIQGFFISDATLTWDDFLQGDARFNSAQLYVAQKVRMAFDPPSTSFAIDAITRSLTELESRLNIAREYSIYGIELVGDTGGSTTLPGTIDGGGPGPANDTTYNGGAPYNPGDTPVYDGGTP